MKEAFLGKRDVFGMILRENDRLIGTIGLWRTISGSMMV